jgi:hypothetical protein
VAVAAARVVFQSSPHLIHLLIVEQTPTTPALTIGSPPLRGLRPGDDGHVIDSSKALPVIHACMAKPITG